MNIDEDEIRMRILRILESADNGITQREIARLLGISLGKTNYCVNGLIEKSYIRAKRFTNSKNRSAYAYTMTPKGIKERIRLTADFLSRKMREYELLKHEISQLQKEVKDLEMKN